MTRPISNPRQKPEDFIEVNSANQQGDFNTIQDALDYCDASGDYLPILVKGNHIITQPLLLAAHDTELYFAPGSRLLPVGNIVCFKAPTGLTDVCWYKIFGKPTIVGDPTKTQTLFELNDVNAFGNIEFRNGHITGIKKFVDWAAYGDYTYQTIVLVYNTTAIAPEGDATLVSTPVPAGTYNAAASLKLIDCNFDGVIASPSNIPSSWSLNADVDIHLERVDQFKLKVGSAFNGITMSRSFINCIGTGDITVSGGGWDIYDCLGGLGSAIASRADDGSGNQSDVRWVISAMKVDLEFATVSFLTGVNSIVDFRINYFWDLSTHANPGIEMGTNCTVHDTHFKRSSQAGFPNGCIKLLNNATGAKVHDCDFAANLAGKAIIETTGCTKNIFYSNTGYGINGGSTIVDVTNTIRDNNIN